MFLNVSMSLFLSLDVGSVLMGLYVFCPLVSVMHCEGSVVHP